MENNMMNTYYPTAQNYPIYSYDQRDERFGFGFGGPFIGGFGGPFMWGRPFWGYGGGFGGPWGWGRPFFRPWGFPFFW